MPPPAPAPTPTPAPPAYNPHNPFQNRPGATRSVGAGLNVPQTGTPRVDADALLSEITREQFADYQQRYRPLERQYAKFLQNDDWIEQGAAQADARVGAAYQTSAEITDREKERYGLDMTPDQARSMARMRGIGLSTSRGVARNTTAAALDDVRTQGLNAMAGYGRGLADQSQGIAGGVANRQAGVDAANDQMAAQERAGMMATGASIAALGGPVGWGVGGAMMAYGMFLA